MPTIPPPTITTSKSVPLSEVELKRRKISSLHYSNIKLLVLRVLKNFTNTKAILNTNTQMKANTLLYLTQKKSCFDVFCLQYKVMLTFCAVNMTVLWVAF